MQYSWLLKDMIHHGNKMRGHRFLSPTYLEINVAKSFSFLQDHFRCMCNSVSNIIRKEKVTIWYLYFYYIKFQGIRTIADIPVKVYSRRHSKNCIIHFHVECSKIALIWQHYHTYAMSAKL